MATPLGRKAGTVDYGNSRRLTNSPQGCGTEHAVESTVQREGGEQVIGEELTGEVDCGGRRTAGRKKRKRREGRRVSERGVERARRGGGLFRL